MLAKLFGVDPQKRFWQWFEANAGSLAAVRSGGDPILQDLSRELRKVHPGLAFEMGLGRMDGAALEFIVSANGVKKVFPVVEQLVACAPTLPQWKIIPFRQPKGFVPEVRYENFLLKTEDVWFSHKHRQDKLDLMIYIRGLSPSNAEKAISACFIMLDNELGEYRVATGIGHIEHQPLPDNPAARGFQPLSALRTVFAQL